MSNCFILIHNILIHNSAFLKGWLKLHYKGFLFPCGACGTSAACLCRKHPFWEWQLIEPETGYCMPFLDAAHIIHVSGHKTILQSCNNSLLTASVVAAAC